ncbi:hypothetical protein JVU11DRAFT_11631 [Chiua virens]|nr:hypothetical protein JVU11DRAFT_11631 [Chiua virens]
MGVPWLNLNFISLSQVLTRAMSAQTALVVSLARGPLIGTFLGLALYGVTCMQAFFYFRTYEGDGWRLKMTVALLVALETAHAAMSVWLMDDYLIVQYGNIQALQSANWSSTLTYMLGLLIDFYVYLYFTWRIWLFTRNAWIVVFMCAISITREVISILATVMSVLKPTWRDSLDTSRTLILVGNALFIAGDTFSACVMAYHLTRRRSWTDTFQHTRKRNLLLNRLIVFFVATGAMTSLVDVVSLIFTLTQPQGTAFLSTFFVQTRLYANSLLASLNLRNATVSVYDDAQSPPVPIQCTPPSGISIVSGERGVSAGLPEGHKSDDEFDKPRL